MFNLFKKKEKTDDGVVVLEKPEPNVCGGKYTTLDTKAPKQITCDEMTLFCAESELGFGMNDTDMNRLIYVSAFAASADNGTFIFLEKRNYRDYDEPSKYEWALIKDNIFPAITELVRECDMAKNNGYHSSTAGLPRNFGGSIYVEFANGEKISYSDNQSPVLKSEDAKKIVKLFSRALSGEKAHLPNVENLKKIDFSEERRDGGYTKATLTINPDGTGTNVKTSKYNDPTVYNSEKPVDAETIEHIKSIITSKGLLAYAGLPERSFRSLSEKTLTFSFDTGEQITVHDCLRLPNDLGSGVFNIELEMSAKH